MLLRKYSSSDCDVLAKLFYDTVHTVNAKDYTPEQLDAWANGAVDLDAWDRSFMLHDTVVAEEDDRIIGFGDMDPSGYLDRLYVHKDFQRKGVAAAICGLLEQRCSAQKLVTHASITARPFFETCGYRVVREQTVVCRGVPMNNFVMEKIR